MNTIPDTRRARIKIVTFIRYLPFRHYPSSLIQVIGSVRLRRITPEVDASKVNFELSHQNFLSVIL